MATLTAGNGTAFYLSANEVLTVDSADDSSGVVVRLSDQPGGGDSLQGWAVDSTNPASMGPFPVVSRFEVKCVTGQITYSTAAVNLAPINTLILAEEIRFLSGVAAPTDGEPGTGAGIAPSGSLCIQQDGEDSNLYINVGSKASPTWKLFTRAA